MMSTVRDVRCGEGTRKAWNSLSESTKNQAQGAIFPEIRQLEHARPTPLMSCDGMDIIEWSLLVKFSF